MLVEQQRLSHTDAVGKMRMVDVSQKRVSLRSADASCEVRTVLSAATPLPAVDDVDPVHAARQAGVQAAKHTGTLIPLCHPLTLDQILVDVVRSATGFHVSSTVISRSRTGVEMEALVACSFAALSLLDSVRALDPTARVDELVLERKSGGKSGDWGRSVTSTSD